MKRIFVMLACSVLMSGCFVGTIGTTIKINDNCTAEVLYDDGTASLDIKCND
ncbi:hypothetical protein [Candidatus Magnetominusculus xianensis]|uniref:Secreted protein n=1 Tax=Candidatus Magnetominusculus xianensis TaxID=1748249 RepID=A0ABR5SGV3_9BACT|nr:hypothetical protein [Candidatus Magnetominusculus xianensis]KWT81154.1 hypothetical protein ASN18_2660 [Candidatus Magnetominusculus xianensis]MBF0402984.1 hypothetical protein [Nitrospirota bacterium]